ncbi:hypothetical protein GIS00_15645 [Nakamurella sp. YIM 132087]|uniref:Glycosyltransferase RgtA/B/C/D-like domain-containing protein n=1 Tax=Nakamurella alba TaxID=2665158 RepID=A0A7K1FMH8_9ACTN|nr:hypothetical protein [Nakamurella alba]MTD15371.1 hypothetical protein [Nakamurella alba]
MSRTGAGAVTDDRTEALSGDEAIAVPATPPLAPSTARPGTARALRWVVAVVAAALGTVVVGLSYRLSGSGEPSGLYYAVFWVGMLLGTVPTILLLIGTRVRAVDRARALGLLGLFTAVPKYLRNPAGPLYHDEYAHWREVVDIFSTGSLMRPNAIIPIIQFYPGTSTATSAIDAITGLSIWDSGELLILSAHVLSFFAILVLVRTLLHSVRAGAVAAVVYSLNPSVLYFDTQYAYESVTIAWFLWVLAFGVLAARQPRRIARWSLVGGAIVCGAATVLTHHLTSLALIGLLLLVTGFVVLRPVLRGRTARRLRLRRRVRSARRTRQHPGALRQAIPDRAPYPFVWVGITGGVLLVAVIWLVTAAWQTIVYLSPYAGSSVGQLTELAGGNQEAGRELLAASVQPLWERALSGLAPVLIGLVCLAGLLLLRRQRRRWPTDTLALIAFGMVYFPSLPFILAPMGAEGARRSWAFTYAGVALLVALVTVWPGVRQALPRLRRRTSARNRWAVAIVGLVIIMIGNVGAGLNDPYRFPGPFNWGTDTNSASQEARTVAEQLHIQVGPVRAVSDRYTGLALSAYGGVWVATPSTGFPAADVIQTDQDPTPELAEMMVTSRYDYLVVDTRMSEQPAYNGDNFGSADPLPGEATPIAYLNRLNAVPWANLVMSTEHLRVYRLDLARMGQVVVGDS